MTETMVCKSCGLDTGHYAQHARPEVCVRALRDALAQARTSPAVPEWPADLVDGPTSETHWAYRDTPIRHLGIDDLRRAFVEVATLFAESARMLNHGQVTGH